MMLDYAQEIRNLNKYLKAHGYMSEDFHLRDGLSQDDFDRIFREHLGFIPYKTMLQDFIYNGAGGRTFPSQLVLMIQASTPGQALLLRMALLAGCESYVANELFLAADSVKTLNFPKVSQALIISLEKHGRFSPAQMYYPRWPAPAAEALKIRLACGHGLNEMLACMPVPAFCAVLHAVEELWTIISSKGRAMINFPVGYRGLSQDDLSSMLAFQANVMGLPGAIRRWLPDIGNMKLDFIGYQALAQYLDIDNPAGFIEDMLDMEDEASGHFAALVTRLAIKELGLGSLDGLTAASLDHLVEKRAITYEQAFQHPSGGDRYAAAALEEGLGL